MRELERDPATPPGALTGSGVMPAIVVVGPGRLGGSLARAAAQAGLDVALAGRDDALANTRQAEAALLCVPDRAIAQACEGLRDSIPPLRLIGHTSGATDLGALASARKRGASTFSLHPLQTVPDDATDLSGAPCGIAGSDPGALRFAEALAERLGMRSFAVPEENRAAYHAAASIASNLLVALEASAAELADRAGIEDSREVLAPLVLRTAANWARRGQGALTGPIARGDEETVARHVAALRELWPELLPLYEALAQRAREVATDEAVRPA